MNDHTLSVLEYDKVRAVVARYTASGPGRISIEGLVPSGEPGTAGRLLDETREMTAVLNAGHHPPLDGIADIGRVIAKLAVPGTMLQPAELLAVAGTLGAARRLKAFFRKFEEGGAAGRAVPLLCARAAGITPLKASEDAVSAAIDASGEVRDAASPGLRRVRKLIARTRDEIMDRMTRLLRDAERQDVVRDQVITVRDDRYVVPLKPNFRQSISGVVHGHSGSRSTLFVEPLEVVEQNNRLAELRLEEREEVERILRDLTALLARDAAVIATALDAASGIDAVHARARYGQDHGGTVPELSGGGRIVLRSARHPLLVERDRTGAGPQAVPNDIVLEAAGRALVISGPNAGGKTVLLKTIGLLCLMAQAGIPVTAAEGTELPVFRSVFADIGDEQSLEQDLSTFSSHAGRIAGILREARSDSLVLLDELGAGTDPAEGAALGSAVLARLLELGCVSVITTHHNALKLFGARTEGATNGAMEFDPATLRPTYRFIAGRPGRSYGIDMAARLGVPEEVISAARAALSGDEASLDRLLEQVEEDARRLRLERERAEADREAARRLLADAEARARAAAEEARSVRASAKQDARDVLASLRQRLKELSRTEVLGRAAAADARREVEQLAQRLEPAEPVEPVPSASAYDPRPGDRVRAPKLGKAGTVLFVHRDGVEIDAGGLKVRLPLREVVPLGGMTAEIPRAAPGWHAELEEREGLTDRVNLLGMRAAEAVEAVDRFLDRAGLEGFKQVTIIHGLGTGALKEAVTAFLKGHALVASLRPGEAAEGGAGVTVVELK